jgi:hypothetical protein
MSMLIARTARDSLPHRAAPNKAAAARAQITPGPKLLHDGRAVIAKRAYDLPDWLSSYSNVYSQIFLSDACSCLITSALPVVSTSTTSTVPDYTDTIVSRQFPLRKLPANSSQTVSSTYVDVFTATTTSVSTTVYVSIN